MKVCICGSISLVVEINAVAAELKKLGHEVLLPNGVIHRLAEQADFDPVQAKIATDACRAHVEKIRQSDAVLMCNFTKNEIENYIGANSFAELFAAHCLEKPIFAYHSLPEQPYIQDELQAFKIKVINENLEEIRL